MIKVKKLSTPSAVIYIALALVVGSYLYYSQYFIPQKEDILVRKAVRTLSSIDVGMTEKEAFLKSFIDQRLAADILLQLNTSTGLDSVGLTDILSNHVKPLTIENGDWVDPIPQVEFDPGANGEPAFLEIKQVRPTILPVVDDPDSEDADPDLDRRMLSALEKSFFNESFSSWQNMSKSLNAYSSEIQKLADRPREVARDSIFKTDSALVAKVGLEQMFSGVTDNEIFECVTVHAVGADRIYYSNNHGLLDPLKKFDSETSDSMATRFGVNIFKTEVNSTPYVEFRRFVQLGNETLYLSGFMSQKSYDEYLKQIDYFLLIIVLLGTFMLIGAVPLIKVFVINEWERLSDNDVVRSGLSLLLVVFFGSLLVTTVSHYYDVKQELGHDLEAYAKELDHRFIGELDTLLHKTVNFDFNDEGDYNWKNSCNVFFHEFFQTDNGRIESIVLPYDEKGRNWSDSTRIKKFFEKFVYLGERDYIKKIGSGEGYCFSRSDTLPWYGGQFYLESVFSYSRGQTEAVVSFPDGKNPSKTNGISVDLSSLMWEVPPEGFGYALIDNEMNVLFSSKKAKNNFKNMRTAVEGTGFIEQAIAYGKPMRGNFGFGRDGFLGFVRPIKNIVSRKDSKGKSGNPAFYLVTFANNDLMEWHTGLTSLLASLTGFVILIMALFVLVLQKFFRIKRDDYRYFKKINFYDTIFPERHDGLTYVFLTFVSVAGILSGFLLFEYGLRALMRYGVVQILLFAALRPLLMSYSKSAQSSRYKKAYFAMLVTLIVLALIYRPGILVSDTYAGFSFDQVYLFLYTAVIMSLAWLLKAKLRATKGKPFALRSKNGRRFWVTFLKSENARRAYVFSTFVWVMAVLVMPFLLISEKCREISENSFEAMAGFVLEKRILAEEDKLNHTYHAYHDIGNKVTRTFRDSAHRNFLSTELYFASNSGLTDGHVSTSPFFDPLFTFFAGRYSYHPLYASANSGTGYFHTFDRSVSSSDSELSGASSNYKFFVFFVTLIGLFALTRMFLHRIVFNISEELQGARIHTNGVINGLIKHREYRDSIGEKLRLFLVGVPRSRRTSILENLGLHRKDIGFIDFGRNTSFLDAEYAVENIPVEILNAKAVVVRFWFPENITSDYLERLRKLTRYMEEADLYHKHSIILSDLAITQIEERWYMMRSEAESVGICNEVMLFIKEWFRNYREFVLPIAQAQFRDSRAVSGQIGYADSYDDYLNKSYYAPIYFSVWHSLSVKERFILYDLAEDGLLNARDSYILMKLRRKGIIYYSRDTYRMKLFHRSFKLFVRHGVSTEEIMEIEAISKKNGSWGQIRLALLLLILAMLLFINTLMPNMFNALIGAIGVIASFSGVVSQLSGKFNLPQWGRLFGGNKASGT